MTINHLRRAAVTRYAMLSAVCWTTATLLTVYGAFFTDPNEPRRSLLMVQILLVSVAVSATLLHILGRTIAPVAEAFRLGYDAGKTDASTPKPHRRSTDTQVVSLADHRASR